MLLRLLCLVTVAAELLRGETTLAVADPTRALGHLEALVERYLNEYDAEEARWAEQKSALDGVVDATVDQQQRLRAIGHRQNMQAAHEADMERLAGMMSALDKACERIRPGWQEQFGDVATRIARVQEAFPAATA